MALMFCGHSNGSAGCRMVEICRKNRCLIDECVILMIMRIFFACAVELVRNRAHNCHVLRGQFRHGQAERKIDVCCCCWDVGIPETPKRWPPEYSCWLACSDPFRYVLPPVCLRPLGLPKATMLSYLTGTRRIDEARQVRLALPVLYFAPGLVSRALRGT